MNLTPLASYAIVFFCAPVSLTCEEEIVDGVYQEHLVAVRVCVPTHVVTAWDRQKINDVINSDLKALAGDMEQFTASMPSGYAVGQAFPPCAQHEGKLSKHAYLFCYHVVAFSLPLLFKGVSDLHSVDFVIAVLILHCSLRVHCSLVA